MAGSIEHAGPSVTPLAVPIALPDGAAVDDRTLASVLHPAYGGALARVPPGTLVHRGLPFLRPGVDGRRWLAIDAPVEVSVPEVSASHLVLLHFCDAWRDESGGRPPGVPLGWVRPVAEPLVRVAVTLTDDHTVETVLRRRFEVNEGLIGWGSMAFLAVPHTVEVPLDWRGPHARQGPGRRAEAGHAGPLAILPGSWGADQTGVQDHVPSAAGDLTMWLYALDLRGADDVPQVVRSIALEPIEGPGHGRLVVLVAATAFTGAGHPLRWSARRAFRVEGAGELPIDVDLGLVARRATLEPAAATASEADPVPGWGGSDLGTRPVRASDRAAEGPPASELLELSAADDAILGVGTTGTLLRELAEPGASVALGPVRIVALPAASGRLEVSVRSADGAATAARVRVVALDGRNLPPLGHRLELNPGIAEDSGAGILLGGAPFAYVDSAFGVDVPAEGAVLELVRGLETPPLRHTITPAEVASGTLHLQLDAEVTPAGGRWVSGDTHVHFLAPSTALLQARAEHVNVVHLLATQWGDHHTSTTDLGGDLASPDGRHAVWVGSENRQNMLGHIGIVGTPRPVLPFASGGPPEGPIGAPVTHLMADWLARCREQGGLAIGAHFPLPMAEIAADIDAGLLDALELQCFDGTLESPPLAEWYRYLDAGYRLPLVGGTDKMSAEVPLGQVRTWARLDDDEVLTFASWSAALRAGRTFVTSGPLLELRADGLEPGESLRVDAGGSIEVVAEARAAQAIISGLEMILDGNVVASVAAPRPTGSLVLRERIRVERTGWLAARSRSPYAIGSAFATVMAAHTSPVYLDVPGRPRSGADMSLPLALVDGTRAWIETLATVADEGERRRFREFLDRADARLRERGEKGGA